MELILTFSLPFDCAILTIDIVNCAGETVTYPCDKCGRRYKYKESLSRHRNHECGVEPRFACSVCAYKTKQRSNLIKHVFTRHGPPEKTSTLYMSDHS